VKVQSERSKIEETKGGELKLKLALISRKGQKILNASIIDVNVLFDLWKF